MLDVRLANVIKSKKAIVLAGAGVSIATSGNPLSGWNGLLCDALSLCKRHFPDQLDEKWLARRVADLEEGTVFDKMNVASQVIYWLNQLGQENYPRWVEATIGTLVVKYPVLIQAIGALNLPILTTNYDTLIERVLTYDLATWEQQEACSQIIKGKRKGVLHVHGCWKNPPAMILDFNSYQQIQADDFIQTLMRSLEYNHSIIFVGFGSGMEDPHFQGFLNWAKGKFLNPQTQHFILVRASEVPKGLPDNIIPVVYGDKHEALPAFLEQLAPKKKKPRASTKKEPVAKPEGLEAFLSVLNTTHPPVALHSVERFIQHNSSNQELAKDINLLCMLPRMHRKILAAYWHRHDVARKLTELTIQCPFINNGEIATSDRILVRNNWEKHGDPIVREVLQQLEKILDNIRPVVNFDNSDFFNWYVQYVNLQSWKSGADAIPALLNGLLLGVLTNEDVAPMIALAKELLMIYPEQLAFAAFLENKSFEGLSSLVLSAADIAFITSLPHTQWAPLEKVCLYFVLGYAYYGKADYRMAVYYFDLAFTFSDGFFPQAEILARAYLDAVSAVVAYTTDTAILANCLQWIEKFGFSVYDLPFELGRVYYQAKEYEPAVDFWKRHLKAAPADVNTWHLLLVTLFDCLGDYEEAIAVYDLAPAAIQQLPFLQLLIGNCYLEEGNYTRAQQYYEQVLAGDAGGKCEAMRALAELYDEHLDEPQTAYTYYDKALEEKTGSYEKLLAQISYLSFLIDQDKKAKALSLLLAMEQPLNYNFLRLCADDLNNVSWYLYELNTRLDLAEKLSRRAQELAPNDLHVLHTFAAVLIHLKKWEEAASYLANWFSKVEEEEVRSRWRDYSQLFKDTIAQHRQEDMGTLLADKSSNFWLCIRWALYKATEKGRMAVVPESIALLVGKLYRELTSNQPPKAFPE